MTKMSDYGWDKIAKVDPQTWTDENGRVEFEMLWLIDRQGNVWERSLRTGEDIATLAAGYKRRGYTDANCILFREAGR